MTTDQPGFDPAEILGEITAATEHLLRTAEQLTDAEVRAPSLLPDWSRGHLLSHLARNADGGRRLLTWARTGVETPEYPSLAARAREIEAGADRSAAELLADVRDSAAAFEAEYRSMPPEAWHRTVRWTAGQEHPAARAADSRLCEVLFHHADLDAGYAPSDWPSNFVASLLARVVTSFNGRDDAPAVRLLATDTGADYTVGGGEQLAPTVRGTQHALLAWLVGRSSGADLTVDDAGALPTPPFLF
ncbi:maleylpyruvate isomerase family mycothiol-dependent enzyme [Streptacidiphilus fuscans]|uniref:Maleylpyruvate isomerase family mycothiol-dependent enzyme n=1 Tax=Streptacidiphilus fuscans TaxID=2789292 RepID=A0A931B4M3_9ACTN|nr:maleylpyruvate isomerase family mycothiol-dependent enzyme [Streptacidiphilus fuscans]MBF9066825.1 maleylpyruvate isomerase family mycothiol-dependent enzyme [Streptacidiphilus fuscans]